MKETYKKIGIIGAGSLGIAIYSFLKIKGFDVFCFDKDLKLIKKIKKEGLEIYNKRKIKIQPFKIFKDLKFPFENLDFIIISVKSYDIKDVLKDLPEEAFSKPIVLVQNGLGVEDFFKGKRKLNLYRFVCHLAVYRKEGNKIFLKILKGENYLGGGDEKSGKIIASSLSSAGFKTLYKRDIKKYSWEKTILNCLLNPLCAIFQKNMKEVLKIGGIEFVLENILRESLEVARAEGIIFNRNFEREALRYIKKGKDHIPSMVFDIKRGKTEIDFLNGRISKIGKKHNIETPVNNFIVSLIKRFTDDRNI
ncbi:MAG: 2-dehydropantoate 2-reductase [Thermoanaerobaculia bacterium]